MLSVCFLAGLSLVFALAAISHASDVDDHKPPIKDILNKQLNPKSEPTIFSLGIRAVWVAPTDATEFGYGLAAPIEMSALAPMIIEGSFQVHWSNLKTLFPDQNLYALTFELALLFRQQAGSLAPYAGIGISYTSQSWPCDRCAELPPYDMYMPSATGSIDLGDDVYPDVRTGVVHTLGERISLVGDVRYAFFKPRVPVVVTSFPSGNETHFDQEIDATGLSLRLGIQVQLFKKE